jgi:hypothetical protein
MRNTMPLPCKLASRSLPAVGLALWVTHRRWPEHLHPWPSVCGSISQRQAGAIVTHDVRLTQCPMSVGHTTRMPVWPVGVRYSTHQGKTPHDGQHRQVAQSTPFFAQPGGPTAEACGAKLTRSGHMDFGLCTSFGRIVSLSEWDDSRAHVYRPSRSSVLPF